MRSRALLCAALAAVGAAAAGVAIAHHSFSAEFDATKLVTVQGTLQRVAWVNPHVAVYIDALDAQGKPVTWQFTSLPPLALRRGGIQKADFRPGEKVTVTGYGAKSGGPTAYLRKVTFANNRVVEVGADRSVPDAPK